MPNFDIPKGAVTVSVASLRRNVIDLDALPERSKMPSRIKINVHNDVFRWTDNNGSFSVPISGIQSIETNETTHGRLKCRALTMTFANNGVPRSYHLLVVPNSKRDWLGRVRDEIATELGLCQHHGTY